MKRSSMLSLMAFICLLIIFNIVPVALAQSIEGYYTVSGRIYDANNNAVPDANVTIYSAQFLVNDYKPGEPLKIPDNPQRSGNGKTTLTGYYQFSGLARDVYYINVDKDGTSFMEKIQIRDGTLTQNIIIPGYVDKSYSSSPTPTPTPAPTHTNVIPPVTGPMPDFGAIIFDFLKILLMLIVALQLVAGVFVIVARIGQSK